MRQRLADIGARIINGALWTRHPHNTPELRREARAWATSTVDGKEWVQEQREQRQRVADVDRLHRQVANPEAFEPTRHYHIGGCCGTLQADNDAIALHPSEDEEAA